MALIGKIRKNFWFVLILLGLALAAFILMDMTSAGNVGGAPTSLTMGSVDGKKIDYRAFQTTEQSYYRNSGQDPFSKRKTIWDFYVQKALLESESDDLGLTVSKDELMDLQFGTNQSEIIRSNWMNPQTGQVDHARLQDFKTRIENGEELGTEFRSYWAEQEKQIIKQQLEGKLNTLVSKSIYTPTWMAEESFKLDNTKVDFNYVKVPFSSIDGSGITVSDEDITQFLQENKDTYEVDEETRVLDYVSFNVFPSAADSTEIRSELDKMKAEFLNQPNTAADSLYAISNSGAYSHMYGSEDLMPESARSQIISLEPGQSYGPFAESGSYLVVKMLDKRRIPDTIEARHIFKSVAPGDPIGLEQARTFMDSIKRAYTSGTSFDTLALRHSEDDSNKFTGGDLGRFTQDRMLPEIAIPTFQGREGGLYTIKTQAGMHLVEVTDRVFNDDNLKYRIATIGKPIKPSQATQDEVYDKVTNVISNNTEMGDVKAAVGSMSGVQVQSSSPMKVNDYAVGTLPPNQATRDMVKWAFDPSTEIGDVSGDIFRFTDPIQYYENNYVLVGLSSIVPRGLPPVNTVRSTVESRVMDQKKANQFIAGWNFSNVNEAASSQGLTVETAADVGSKSALIPVIGKEPDVLAAAHQTAVQGTSRAIIGNSGVFVVSPLSRAEAGTATNLPLLKKSLAGTTQSQINFNLIRNMTKRANVKDERSTFF